ncbi:MAG: hypothetical protein HYU25_06120 [Candidatus Rokubacteria bacterium]|nr:hypothetical protein [Candidatus Rokubacteria bacterium]
MTAQTGATASSTPETRTAALYQEGLIAGLLGAATIALWFLVVDTLNGRPLYTPTVLGTALFRRGATVPLADVLPDFEMVWMFTWVHGLVFAAIGGVAARLLGLAERHPSAGFGILLLFVVFEFGFIAAAMLFAEPVLHALAWPAVLVANMLAAAVMGGYFRLRHPSLSVRP